MKQKEFKLLFCFILLPHDDFFCWSNKMETVAKTAPRVTKLGNKGGRVPQLRTRGTLATSRRVPAWSVTYTADFI